MRCARKRPPRVLSGETVHAIAGAVGIDSGGEPVDVSRERHLQQLLSAGLGGGQARRFLTVDFTTLNGNEICALSVRPADAPVYLRDGAEPRLYVRSATPPHPSPWTTPSGTSAAAGHAAKPDTSSTPSSAGTPDAELADVGPFSEPLPHPGSSSASRPDERGKALPCEPRRHLRKRLAVDRTAKIRHRFTNEAADSFIRKHAAKLAVLLGGDVEVNLQGPCDRHRVTTAARGAAR